MKEPPRSRIVWYKDSPPKEFVLAAGKWGLQLVPSTTLDSQDEMGQLLAILIPAGLLPQFPPRTLLAAADRGVLCRVVASGGDERRSKQSGAAQGQLADLIGKGFPLQFVRVVAGDVHVLIRECVRHDGGPPPSLSLKINADKQHLIDATAEVLLRRVFAAFHTIDMENLDGGRSGTGDVWRVAARHEDGREPEPFLVKIGKPEELDRERAMFEAEVRHFVPFPSHPPLVPGGFIVGAQRALLASMFVTRAQRLDEYVRAVQSPELALTGLFAGALRNWRTQRTRKCQALGKMFVEDKSDGRILPHDPNVLNSAHALASKLDSSIPPPTELLQLLAAVTPVDYIECHGHGDLHSRNAFVRAGGADVVLIDFPYAGLMPASRDPSRLEVNLAFDVCDHKSQFLSDDILRSLYTAPLLPCLAPRESRDGRIEAIRHVRVHVAGEGIQPPEYHVATACHLLRYAREATVAKPNTAVEVAKCVGSPEELRLRGTAYLLAARLILAMPKGSPGVTSKVPGGSGEPTGQSQND